MAAILQVGEVEATCDEYRWECRDSRLEGLLNALLDPLGPSGGDPNPDATAAEDAATALGGKVIRFDETPEPEPGVVY